MPNLPFKPLGKTPLGASLVSVALVSGVISATLLICVFIAGSAITHSGGREHLLFKDLALVSFDGIIANNDTSEFLVHIYWFVNSLAWEYPDAPEGIPKAGYTYRGLQWGRTDIRKELRKIADDLQLPKDTYTCDRWGGNGPPCQNIFFEAWRSWLVADGLPLASYLIWIMVVSAVVVCLMGIVKEWMIRKWPYAMRCRCIFLKRWCPCPKGTREEIEKLDDYTWDKIRLTYWLLIAVYFLLPAGQTTISAIFFLKYIGYMEDRLPEGISMSARRDMKGETMLWAAFFVSAVGALCITAKWRMSRRPKGWMDEQSLPQLPRGDVEAGGDSRRARVEATDGNGRYTD
ncbi:hypothetical protein BGZ63DRAFT_346110 [Mariannaea sp. PMI_226]|nr:hypothetical protein BGZ63DRAFT_346110 [Mariannaea sp. PMI_226]